MCVRHLAFVLLIWFPAVLHAQKAKQPCPAPQLDHGFFVPKEEKYPHEEKLIYTCDKGYKPTAEGWWATSTCENGQWSPNPQCIDETSCLPPIITNGNYRVNSRGWYAEHRTIKVTCDDGYELKGQPEKIRCINGTWSPFPVCERSLSSCGEPPQIPHAVIIKRGYQEVFADTSKVQYECEDGYTTDGITTLKSASCSSGNWTGTPSCHVFCAIDPAIYREQRIEVLKLHYLKEGENKIFWCPKLSSRFSIFQCIDGRIVHTQCCFHYEYIEGRCPYWL